METINWIIGDILYTHELYYVFYGQDKGRLYFKHHFGFEFIESPKIISEMIEAGLWKQIKYGS